MKLKLFTVVIAVCLSACTTLTRMEENQLRELKSYGISVDKPTGYWEKPASPLAAGMLNLLPGNRKFLFGDGKRRRKRSYAVRFFEFFAVAVINHMGNTRSRH